MAALNTSYSYHQISGTSRNVCTVSISPPSSRLYQNSLKIQSFPSLQHTHYSNYSSQRAVVSPVAARYVMLLFSYSCFVLHFRVCVYFKLCCVYLFFGKSLQEFLPPALDSTSEPPAVFDGTTRLDSFFAIYIMYIHIKYYITGSRLVNMVSELSPKISCTSTLGALLFVCSSLVSLCPFSPHLHGSP